jgi:SMC interacting uncharacterized protein involved in chromosome segregation
MARRTARSFPDRKISKNLLDFAELLLQELPNEATERQAQKAFQVSFTVWNAVIFADVLQDHRFLDEVQRLIAGVPEMAVLIQQLIARKRALFADDERLIGNWKLRHKKAGVHLWAEARDPHSLSPNSAGDPA